MIRIRGGLQLHYRLNRGDIQSIREVWIDECYRLPFDLKPSRLVDLGANIGLTSLWFAHRYGCQTVIAVEPSPENARLTRLNLERNQIVCRGHRGGCRPPRRHRDISRRRRIEPGPPGRHPAADGPSPWSAWRRVLRRLPPGAEIDLVKMDIEGGEGPLLQDDNVKWLGRVRSIIAEFHPTLIDYPAVIKSVERQGFRYFPAHSAPRLRFDGRIHASELEIVGVISMDGPASLGVFTGVPSRQTAPGTAQPGQLSCPNGHRYPLVGGVRRAVAPRRGRQPSLLRRVPTGGPGGRGLAGDPPQSVEARTGGVDPSSSRRSSRPTESSIATPSAPCSAIQSPRFRCPKGRRSPPRHGVQLGTLEPGGQSPRLSGHRDRSEPRRDPGGLSCLP